MKMGIGIGVGINRNFYGSGEPTPSFATTQWQLLTTTFWDNITDTWN